MYTRLKNKVLLLVILLAAPCMAGAQQSIPVPTLFEDTVATSTPAVLGATTSEMVVPEVVPVVEPVLYFFFDPTCPHCKKEKKFLDKMETKYPELDVQRYDATVRDNQILMRQLAKEFDVERDLGQVPMTYVGSVYVLSYDKDRTTGVTIENGIREVLGMELLETTENTSDIHVPILGSIDPTEYSLAGLAILLGFLDGFNVCSLGALVLIIGLTLKLQRRRAIIIFGGTFIVTTALVYGALIVLWYQIFDSFSAYMNLMKVGIGLLSLGGGLYFLKEYLRMLKQGAVCELTESKWIQKMSTHAGKAFEHPGKLLTVFGAVFAFAAVVAIVEFPCSAAVPVVFAGMLAEAGVSTAAYLGHIGLFVLFYMLDELVIFGIAAYRLKLWMTSGTFTKWAVLAEAGILIAIGVYYLGTMMGIL